MGMVDGGVEELKRENAKSIRSDKKKAKDQSKGQPTKELTP
jgi:hypothetical protein